MTSLLPTVQSAKGAMDEPMAVLKWDFVSPFSGAHIKGDYTLPTRSDAESIRDKMNAEYGAGTHWVEPLNHTKAAREAALKSLEPGDGNG